MPRVREVAHRLPPPPPGVLKIHDFRTDDAARASACVKACEGIPTPLLDEEFLTRLVVSCLHVGDRHVQGVLSDLVQGTKRRQRPRAAGN